MNRRNILVFFIFFTLIAAFPQSKGRLFQFINGNDRNSLSLDLGTTPGITFTSQSVDLSFQYSLLMNTGLSISTDLFIVNNDILNSTLKFGLGWGALLRPSLDGFSSDITLRIPLTVIKSNFKFNLIPYLGMTMYKPKNSIVFGLHGNISYLFNLSGKKKTANE